MYTPEKLYKKKATVSEPTMSTSEIFESLLDSIKSSSLNFHIQQTPFAALISIKKSIIKDKFGNQLKPSNSVRSKSDSCLETENHSLCGKIFQLETLVNSIQSELEEAVSDNETAHKTIKHLETELNDISERVGKVYEHKMADKVKEVFTLKSLNDQLNGEISDIKNCLEKSNDDLVDASKQATHFRNKLKEKEKSLNSIRARKDNLEISVENLESLSEGLSQKVKDSESKLKELEAMTAADENLGNSNLAIKENLVRDSIEEKEVDESIKDVIHYNIETSNNFKVLDKKILNSASKDDENIVIKIDQSNYEVALKDFLDNFADKESKQPKYPREIKEIMRNGYNVVHLSLLDIGKFNPNLKGFLANHHKNFTEEIKGLVTRFGESLDMGSFARGLSVFINKKNYGQ